ncbi:nucleolar protein 6 [Chrysoperla carnea]|uniref:nucleolar protein 6 n=1 Tax=Chrysoperla carnea TaxID=189513 RepID=UPI001D099997|nr:nucleolar protein 6 [Chrysoperla carnea]
MTWKASTQDSDIDSIGKSDDESAEETHQEEPVKIGSKRKQDSTNETTSRKKNKKLFQPPTVEELNELRETENLFNSNLFRLQIEEILKEITLEHKHEQQINSFFNNFKKFVEEIPDSNEYQLSDLSFLDKYKIKLPLFELPTQTRGFFKFIKPKNVEIFRLHQTKCTILRRREITIDINLETPLKCFHKTDAVNGRFLLKRAIYLGYLASKLRENKKFRTERVSMRYTFQNGNLLKPLLLIRYNSHIEFRIHVAVEPNLLKYSKFNPLKNNVHGVWFFEHDDNFESSTPFYNSCILEDLTSMENNQVLYESLKDSKNIQDGLKLLQVWLRQRGLDVGFGGFTTELMAMFVVYLIKTKKLNNAMSSYQVVRNVWVSLGDSHWTERGQGITLSNIKKENQPDMNEFHDHFPVVFVDVTGFYNLAAFLNPHIYLKVCTECKKAVQYLDDTFNVNNFRHLFTEKMLFHQQYDQIVKVNIKNIKFYDTLIERHERLDYMTFKHPLWLKQITNVLKKGLSDRLTQLCPKLNDPPEWDINESVPTIDEINSIIIGFNLNEEKAFNKIEKGPIANLPEAIEFREFWGKNKTELRRFNDGSIMECIIWDSSDSNKLTRRDICTKIINYLLESKLFIKSERIQHICDEFMQLDVQDSQEDDDDLSLRIIQSYDNLVKKLRSLQNLPLDITAAQGASSVFSYTDVNPGATITKILPKHNKFNKINKKMKPETYKSIKPFDVVLNLALSGKWPQDLQALRHLKAAFYLKIAKQLETGHKIKCFVHTKYLDVVHDDWVFRLYLLITKEIGLMKKIVDTDEAGLVKYRDTEESLQMERQLIHLPKLTSALLGLHSQYVSYSSAARLTKRWLCSQLLDNGHIPDVVTDLIIASLYVTPEPYDVPKLPQIAFIRFLQKMVTTDWQTDPFIVNFNNELTSTEINEIHTTFTKTRQTLPPMFIITPYDQGKSIWTREAPTLNILLRLQVLAKQTLEFMNNYVYDSSEGSYNNCERLFKASLSGYNVIIKLKATILKQKSKLASTSVSQMNHFKDNTIIATNPIESYLNDLRQFYDEYALFFYNPHGGSSIVVLWKPPAFKEREFKVSHINGRKLSIQEDTASLIVNKEAILDDFRILGAGLIESVEEITT